MAQTRARRRHGGSVRKLASGRWQVRVYDRAAGRHVSAGTHATKADADAALADAVADQGRGRWVAPDQGRTPLGDYLESWIAEHPGLAVSTRDRYRSAVRIHIAPHLGAASVAEVTTASVRRWHARLCREASWATAAKAYRVLSAAMNTAVADGLVAANPCQVKGAGQERSVERPIATTAEVAALAEAMPQRWRALVLVAAWCGLRLGELTALTRADVDLTQATVKVAKSAYRGNDGRTRVGPPKTDAGRRTVAIPPPLIDELAAHLERYVDSEPDALVFTNHRGNYLERSRVGRTWRRVAASLGREDLRFHDLRHTGNTLAAATGASTAEIMGRMGHASPQAALAYQHATQDRDQAIAGVLGEFMEGPGDAAEPDGAAGQQ
jgi:integrase